MPRSTSVRVVTELASRGYNAEREAVTLIAGANDPERTIERAVESVPENALTISAEHVRRSIDADEPASTTATHNPSVSGGTRGRWGGGGGGI